MSTGDSEGPAWNKFWMSLDQETESMMSGEGNSRAAAQTPDPRSLISPEPAGRPGMDRLDSVFPGDSASHHGADSPEPSATAGSLAQPIEDVPFAFKFKAPSGRMHRLQVVAAAGIADFVGVVAEKLGAEVDSVGGVPTFEDGKLGHAGFALSYLDNEGDTVSLTTDYDLVEAITMAKAGRRDKVDLFVHDPEKPPMAATVAPQPALAPQPASAKPPTPPESVIQVKQAPDSDADAESEHVTQRKKEKKGDVVKGKQQEQQIIAGVPNELLLPGAIVTLAVVIIGIFAVTRSTSK